ncbi:MAG TPA: tannase/feruloyl esterase family alpha/beta hydrolase, partial [Terriglobia bacterium]|nr:tannase/feruloyl esterase family alpha/beta hydrolase [Terriglobia bacterium]
GVVTTLNPARNVSAALEQWVEKGVAPDSIIATKYVNPSHPSNGIEMTRPLCPYPQIAKYNGSGNPNEAANFVCALPLDQFLGFGSGEGLG